MPGGRLPSSVNSGNGIQILPPRVLRIIPPLPGAVNKPCSRTPWLTEGSVLLTAAGSGIMRMIDEAVSIGGTYADTCADRAGGGKWIPRDRRGSVRADGGRLDPRRGVTPPADIDRGPPRSWRADRVAGRIRGVIRSSMDPVCRDIRERAVLR